MNDKPLSYNHPNYDLLVRITSAGLGVIVISWSTFGWVLEKKDLKKQETHSPIRVVRYEKILSQQMIKNIETEYMQKISIIFHKKKGNTPNGTASPFHIPIPARP